MKTILTLAALVATATQTSAAIIAQQDYDGTNFGFNEVRPNNSFVDDRNKIDGANSLGLYGNRAHVRYNLNNPVNILGEVVTISCKLRADYDIIGNTNHHPIFNHLTFLVLDDKQGEVVRLAFKESTDKIHVTSGGYSHMEPSIWFNTGETYTFSATTRIGSNSFDYTVSSDSSGSVSGTALASYHVNMIGSINSIYISMAGPGEYGDDVYVDSIKVSIVPEPTSASLLALGTLALILRRHK